MTTETKIHVHHEIIKRRESDGHEIGTCSCGREKDYTLLRTEDVWSVKRNFLKGEMNMNQIMKQAHPKPKYQPKKFTYRDINK
jgi:hypothetical protein